MRVKQVQYCNFWRVSLKITRLMSLLERGTSQGGKQRQARLWRLAPMLPEVPDEGDPDYWEGIVSLVKVAFLAVGRDPTRLDRSGLKLRSLPLNSRPLRPSSEDHVLVGCGLGARDAILRQCED